MTDGQRSTPPYEVRFTIQFLRATRKVDSESLRVALEEIAHDPYSARGSHTLSHDWAGFRAADFTRRERIIYRVCEECVRNHQETLHALDCCTQPERPKNLITFVDFGDYHPSAGRRRLIRARSYE